MNHKRVFVSFLLLFSIFVTACSPKTQVVNGPAADEIETDLVKQLDVEKIYATIEELTTEPRVAGTESEKQAATFLTEQLEEFGYDVEQQPFDFERYVMPNTTALTVDGFDDSFSPAAFQYTVSGNVTATVIDAGHGLKSDYRGIDAQGKIALVAVESTYFYELVLNAAEAGAVAILIHFPKDKEIDTWTLGKHNEAYIPALALSHNDSSKLLKLMKGNPPVTATVAIEGAKIEKTKSQNLIVTKQATSEKEASDDIVIIGAHYDSVEKAPGASDNASGTAVVLELARLFKDVPTTKELRFLFFGAEEEGLIGSKEYVNAMTEDDIKRSIAMFNLDMVGSADAGDLAIHTVDGMDNVATIVAGKVHEELNGGDSIETEFGDRSDHAPFHEAGIDAALFSYFPLEDWYHSADDTIEKLSKDRLLDVATMVAESALELTVPDRNKK